MNHSFFLTSDVLQEKKIKYLSLLMDSFKLRLRAAFEIWNKNSTSRIFEQKEKNNRKNHHDRILRHANQNANSKEILKIKKILNIFNNYCNDQLASKSKFNNLFIIFSNLIKNKLKSGFQQLSIRNQSSQTKNVLLFTLLNLYAHKLQVAFSSIKTAASNDLVKAYCNTLWKWKLANVKAGFDTLEKKYNKVHEKNKLNKLEMFKKIVVGKFSQKFSELKQSASDTFWKENFFYLHIAAKMLNLKKTNIQRTAFMKIWTHNKNQPSENVILSRALKTYETLAKLVNNRKYATLLHLFKQSSKNHRNTQLAMNLQILSRKYIKNTFAKLKVNSKLNKQSQIHKGIICLIRMAKPYRKSQMFHCWNLLKEYSPAFPKVWYKRAVNVLAKHSAFNRQIALWRLRDNIHVSGVYLSAPKIVKCKKMFNNIRILYERAITKAFYSIERAGTGESRIIESKIVDTKPKIPGSKLVVSEIYKSTAKPDKGTDFMTVVLILIY